MIILFVSSGNNITGISPIVKKQGESLIKQGHDVHFYRINGKGIKGYLKNIKPLKKVINQLKPDVIHAHYSLCGYVTSLTRTKVPIVTSLMGSDAVVKGFWNSLIKWHIRKKWNKTITKTEEMKQFLNMSEITVLPNGVDMELFKPIPKEKAQNELGWEIDQFHILFAANPERPEKNYNLFEESIDILKPQLENVVIHVLKDVPHKNIPTMMNAADVVVLSSLREGSPNVIKEAMACSRPIVTTNVGDVDKIVSSVEGCIIVNFSAKEMAEALKEVITKKIQQTTGQDFIQSYLSEEIIAKKLINIYKSIQSA